MRDFLDNHSVVEYFQKYGGVPKTPIVTKWLQMESNDTNRILSVTDNDSDTDKDLDSDIDIDSIIDSDKEHDSAGGFSDADSDSDRGTESDALELAGIPEEEQYKYFVMKGKVYKYKAYED